MLAVGGIAFLLAVFPEQSPQPAPAPDLELSRAQILPSAAAEVADLRSAAAVAASARAAAPKVRPPAAPPAAPEPPAAAPAAEEKADPGVPPEDPPALDGPAGGTFGLVPPGGSLPSGEECAAAVRRDPWEPRPENAPANATRPTGPAPYGMASWTTPEADTAAYRGRVDGDFTGTTDEIIQWASCKWGFPSDLSRAQAAVESTWDQAVAGDGGESRGLFQMKMTVWGGYPNSADSTAFNADWALGLRRACYDGVMWYPQLRGNLPACIGVHFSGDPDEPTWREYTDAVYESERTKPWLAWPSAAGSPPTG